MKLAKTGNDIDPAGWETCSS